MLEPHDLKSGDFRPENYRSGVGIMLLNAENKVFIAKRIDVRSEAWQMPQGGIDDGETALEAALRELKEEIGTNHAEMMQEMPNWLYYDLPEDLQKKLWDGKFKGQKQKWFLFRFLGQDSDIQLETEHPEFLDWKWTEVDSLLDLVIPFKKNLYQQIVSYFTKAILN